jgi:hypothetical protein
MQEAKQTLAPYGVRLFKHELTGRFAVAFQDEFYIATSLLDAVETGIELRYRK